MSVDVELTMPYPIKVRKSGSVFLYENGKAVSVSVKEWNERFPDRLIPISEETEKEYETCDVFSGNLTHHLCKMAGEADLSMALWHPYLIDIEYAKQMITPLSEGLKQLKSDPERFKTYNPRNGWGSYEDLVSFVEEYLEACFKYPEAQVLTYT